MGLYHPLKQTLAQTHVMPAGFATNILAGILAGTFSAGVCSPLELLKTRQQAHPDHGHARSSVIGTFRRIVVEHGAAAIWTGSQVAMIRGGVLTASQCAFYEECKRLVATIKPQLDSGWQTHLVAALATGLVSTTVSNPFDVIKAYSYMRPKVPLLSCVKEVLQHEGPTALLKGWTASYARVGPHTVLILIFNERIRMFLGMEAF
jgi:solute carrier family 25 uncoupling protein 8/9